MTDPVYEYVRGQGWVINPGLNITMLCGTRVRLEVRNPLPGEAYACRSQDYALTNGKPSNSWVTDLVNSPFNYLSVSYEGHKRSGNLTYVTVIPL